MKRNTKVTNRACSLSEESAETPPSNGTAQQEQTVQRDDLLAILQELLNAWLNGQDGSELMRRAITEAKAALERAKDLHTLELLRLMWGKIIVAKLAQDLEDHAYRQLERTDLLPYEAEWLWDLLRFTQKVRVEQIDQKYGKRMKKRRATMEDLVPSRPW